MRYAVHKGALVEVRGEGNLQAIIYDYSDGQAKSVLKSELIEISEESYRAAEQDYSNAKAEQKQISDKMHHLDGEYYRKKNIYHSMHMEARQKEIRIINGLLKGCVRKV